MIVRRWLSPFGGGVGHTTGWANTTMVRPRFSIQALLLWVTFVGLCLACWNAYQTWYLQNHSAEFVSIQLQRAIRNGDSVMKVSGRLGAQGVDMDADNRLDSSTPDAIRQIYASRPNGLLGTDQLLSFHLEKSGIILQFRDGVLVNHDPTEFTNVGSPFGLHKIFNSPVGYKVLHFLKS